MIASFMPLFLMTDHCLLGYKKNRQRLIDSLIGINKKGRKNNYPVVLVHGTLGFVNDQNAFLKSYWGHAFKVLGK